MIIYYSKSGHSETIAKEIAKKNNMEIMRIEDTKKPSFIKGCYLAFFKKQSKLKEIPKITKAESVIVVAPIWADVFPPAINTLLPTLQAHPDVTYIGSCKRKDGNEKYSPKIKKTIPNVKTIVLPESLDIAEKLKLISELV